MTHFIVERSQNKSPRSLGRAWEGRRHGVRATTGKGIRVAKTFLLLFGDTSPEVYLEYLSPRYQRGIQT